MGRRVNPEHQAQIDSSWHNMLTPPNRLERGLLLDTLLAFQLHHFGVDHFNSVAEKQVKDGYVTLKVVFDRTHPDRDELELTYRSSKGEIRRHERYSGREVNERVLFLFGGDPDNYFGHIMDDSSSSRRTTELQKRRDVELPARMEQITAATQPAPPPIHH